MTRSPAKAGVASDVDELIGGGGQRLGPQHLAALAVERDQVAVGEAGEHGAIVGPGRGVAVMVKPSGASRSYCQRHLPR
jgi:hypothetical protein